MRGRIGGKEIRKTVFSNLSLGLYAYKGQPERLRNSYTSRCPSMKHPLGKLTNPSELITPFLIKKYKESRKIWETIWRTQKNILEPLRVAL